MTSLIPSWLSKKNTHLHIFISYDINDESQGTPTYLPTPQRNKRIGYQNILSDLNRTDGYTNEYLKPSYSVSDIWRRILLLPIQLSLFSTQYKILREIISPNNRFYLKIYSPNASDGFQNDFQNEEEMKTTPCRNFPKINRFPPLFFASEFKRLPVSLPTRTH